MKNNIICPDKVDDLVVDAYLSGDRILHVTARPARMVTAFRRIETVIANDPEAAGSVIGKLWSSQRCEIVPRQGSGAGSINFMHERSASVRDQHFDLVVFEDVPGSADLLAEIVVAASRILVVRDEAAA